MKLSFLGLAITFVLTGCGSEDDDSNIAPSPEPSNTSSLACFNPILLTPGTSHNLEYVSDDPYDLGLDDVHQVAEAVSEYKGFNDVVALREAQSTVYVQHNESEQTVITLGQIISDDNMKIDYEPNGLALDYNLNEGQKVSYPTVTVIETTDEGMTSSTVDTSLKYLGRETITVPAGTFETCVLEHEFETVENGISSNVLFTRYTGVGNGVVIKEVTTSDVDFVNNTIELSSGSINNEKIQGL